MGVKDIEPTNICDKCSVHFWRSIQAAAQTSREIPDRDTVDIHRLSQWNTRIQWSVHIGRVDVDIVTARRLSTCESMHWAERAPVADGRVVGGDNVQDFHCVREVSGWKGVSGDRP